VRESQWSDAVAFAAELKGQIEAIAPSVPTRLRRYFERLTEKLIDVGMDLELARSASSPKWADILIAHAESQLQTISFVLEDMKDLARD
jgi:hypothetical protein